MKIVHEGKKILMAEAGAIARAARSLGRPFQDAVAMLADIKGKIIVSGIGKSGIIGRRIASVFSSTGTPAFFMHPTEGMHGDIGIISKNDAVILISHSGKSDELLTLLPYIKRQGVKIIAITRDQRSPLSKFSDITLPTHVVREACPFNLVPSTSSAVTAALGDSLAILLLKIKGFRKRDYKSVHPGGAIGKRLLYRVGDLMYSGADAPVIDQDQTLGQAIHAMSANKNLGMVCVRNRKDALTGVFTDGDLRRLLQTGRADLSARAAAFMKRRPKTVLQNQLAVEALAVMERHAITSLIVVKSKKQKKIAGVIHLHSILRAGVV
jgi:arabinose-5-phosphate isomerase